MSLERVKPAFDAQGFMKYIGAEIIELEAGKCVIQIPFAHGLSQQHGFFHGGILATLADNSSGFAAFSLMSVAQQPLSLEFKINFLNKADGELAIAYAEVVKNGRTVKVCKTDVFVLKNGEKKLCATAIASIMATKIKGFASEGES